MRCKGLTRPSFIFGNPVDRAKIAMRISGMEMETKDEDTPCGEALGSCHFGLLGSCGRNLRSGWRGDLWGSDRGWESCLDQRRMGSRCRYRIGWGHR